MPKTRQGGQGTPATVALARAGVSYVVHPYDHDPAAASYGLEAARCLGVEPSRVFKTLVAAVDDALVVAIVPVSGSLDLKSLAQAMKGKRAVMASTSAAERVTGYVVGGISPLGQRQQVPTVLDRSALTHDSVYVSAGRRGIDIELAPTDLVALTSATVAPIGRSG